MPESREIEAERQVQPKFMIFNEDTAAEAATR
jgi:hypothetical protein